MTRAFHSLALPALLFGLLTVPDDAAAQRFPGFGGLEFRLGVADADESEKGTAFALDADFGYLFVPSLRLYGRFEHFGADTDVQINGVDVGGSLSTNGFEAGGRFDLLPTGKISPYGSLAVNFSSTATDGITDSDVSDDIEGIRTEFTTAVGAAWRFGQTHTWSAVADIRYIGGGAVNRTIVSAGLRWNPRGRAMYERPAPPPPPPPPPFATP